MLKPKGSVGFLGPTSSGKTTILRAAAAALSMREQAKGAPAALWILGLRGLGLLMGFRYVRV